MDTDNQPDSDLPLHMHPVLIMRSMVISDDYINRQAHWRALPDRMAVMPLSTVMISL